MMTKTERLRVSLPYESRLAMYADAAKRSTDLDTPLNWVVTAPIEDLERAILEHPDLVRDFLTIFPVYAPRLLDGGPHPNQDLIDAYPVATKED